MKTRTIIKSVLSPSNSSSEMANTRHMRITLPVMPWEPDAAPPVTHPPSTERSIYSMGQSFGVTGRNRREP